MWIADVIQSFAGDKSRRGICSAALFLSFTSGMALAAADGPALKGKPDAGLIAAIGVAARDSIDKMPDQGPNIKIGMLENLAKAELRAGDRKGAQAALAAARSTPQLPDYLYSELFVLSVQADDERNAVAFIQKTSANNQIEAYGRLAVARIKVGEVAAADKAVEIIDDIFTTVPHEPATQVWNPMHQSSLDRHDSILGDIAKNFAMKGDIPRAQALAKKISNKGSLSGVLAEIAKAKHKAGDQNGANDTLMLFKSAADEYYAKDPAQVAIIESLAFGLAGEPDKASELIAALPLKQSRDIAYSRLSEALAKNGDLSHARKIADEIDNIDDIILIGKMQHNAGNDGEAAKTFLAANQSLLKDESLARIDRFQRIEEIVDGLSSAGDFSDAISESAGLDNLNRPQYLVHVIREEVKRADMRAIRDTAPIAVKIADSASLLTEKDLTNLSIVLNQAGMKDDAKSILSIAQRNADHLLGWQKMDALNAIKGAQLALGDKNGAAKTEHVIQQETAAFNIQIEMLASQGTVQTNAGNAPNYAEAIKLLQQMQASDNPKAKNELMQRALALVGNKADVLESLIFVSARFSPRMQKLKVINEVLAHGDFSSATKVINSMTGSDRDAGLALLVRAEAQGGQWQSAFDAAADITNPAERANSLLGIISIEAPLATP